MVFLSEALRAVERGQTEERLLKQLDQLRLKMRKCKEAEYAAKASTSSPTLARERASIVRKEFNTTAMAKQMRLINYLLQGSVVPA